MKLTKKMLKQIVKEEAAKFGNGKSVEDTADDAEETDADEYADSLEKHIDYIKALKIEEARLHRRLKAINEQKKLAAAKIAK